MSQPLDEAGPLSVKVAIWLARRLAECGFIDAKPEFFRLYFCKCTQVSLLPKSRVPDYQPTPEIIAAMPKIIGDAPLVFTEKDNCPSCGADIPEVPEEDVLFKANVAGEVWDYQRRKFSS